MRRLLLCTILASACGRGRPAISADDPTCDAGNGGITLPTGYCAAVYADGIGVARHLVAALDGIVYVALESGARTSAGTSRRREPGGIVLLKDTTGDGRADVITRIAADGGTGIALRGDWLYFTTMTTVQRYRLAPDRMGMAGPPDTLVAGIPPEGHISRSIAFDTAGQLFVHVGSDSNVCGIGGARVWPDPCPELPTRAGIWRYDATRRGQRHPEDGEHWVTGLRNAVGLAWDSVTGKLYAASHGRDGLAATWPRLFTAARSAEQPSEEFVAAEQGDDFGWPYCYHDNALGRKVLAPEYGGDGEREGRCAAAKEPVIGFPGHWGPNDLLLTRAGAYIAFHGSWNRAPRPQAGYKVVFVPRAGASFGPAYETFADGFAGGKLDPGAAVHRPAGLAEGPGGVLYISDDQQGRIWRVVRTGKH